MPWATDQRPHTAFQFYYFPRLCFCLLDFLIFFYFCNSHILSPPVHIGCVEAETSVLAKKDEEDSLHQELLDGELEAVAGWASHALHEASALYVGGVFLKVSLQYKSTCCSQRTAVDISSCPPRIHHKSSQYCLGRVAQWSEHGPVDRRVMGCIPS